MQLVALLGPSRTVEFEFHLTDWLGIASNETSLPVLPEVRKLRGMRILCFSGDEEESSLCRLLGPGLAESIVLKGGHHFGGDYKSIAETILKQARLPTAISPQDDGNPGPFRGRSQQLIVKRPLVCFLHR